MLLTSIMTYSQYDICERAWCSLGNSTKMKNWMCGTVQWNISIIYKYKMCIFAMSIVYFSVVFGGKIRQHSTHMGHTDTTFIHLPLQYRCCHFSITSPPHCPFFTALSTKCVNRSEFAHKSQLKNLEHIFAYFCSLFEWFNS